MARSDDDIAVIGIALRLPDANTVETFWSDLARGHESIRALDDTELAAAGVDAATRAQRGYVAAGAHLADRELFDATLFGMTPREAAAADPQIRILLENSRAALDHAGYPAGETDLSVGVFASAGPNNHGSDPAADLGGGAQLGVHTLNQSDYLATNVAYRLDLRGPALTVLTACSSSLVAVHLACQSLRAGDCDIALITAATLEYPLGGGYRYAPGGILSPDGHCRPFDAAAAGTVFTSGALAVVLKPLADAEADGDRVHAVLVASAVNNDGADKVSFGAPSPHGQTAVIMEALAVADVDPAQVSYVETHGTGTPLGDPIEVRSLTEAFTRMQRAPLPAGSCRIGSVKGNLGHLGPAAGLAGLVKTVLALEHEQLPPSINVETPNPRLELEDTPFTLARRLQPWPRTDEQRYAAVSSFGIGGTNAHVLLREAPAVPAAPVTGVARLVVWSARDEQLCDAAQRDLAGWFPSAGEAAFADAVGTLQHRRPGEACRRAAVARGAVAAAAALDGGATLTASDAPLTLPGRWAGSDAFGQLTATVPGLAAQLREWAGSCRAADPRLGAAVDALLGSAGVEPAPDAVPALVLGAALALARCWRTVAPGVAVGGAGIADLAARCIAGELDPMAALAARIGDPDDTAAAPLDLATHWRAVGQLWVAGIDLDWTALGAPPPARPAPLPARPLHRTRYRPAGPAPAGTASTPAPTPRSAVPATSTARTTVYVDATGRVAATAAGRRAVVLAPGGAAHPVVLALRSTGSEVEQVESAQQLLATAGGLDDDTDVAVLVVDALLDTGTEGAADTLAALHAADPALRILLAVRGGVDVSGAETLDPAAVTLAALPYVHVLDLGAGATVAALSTALGLTAAGYPVAVRGARCWVCEEVPVTLAPATARSWPLRHNALVLVADHDGRASLAIARALGAAGLRVALDVHTAAGPAIVDALDGLAELGADVVVTAWNGGVPAATARHAALVVVESGAAAGPGPAWDVLRAAGTPGAARLEVAAFVRCAEADGPDPVAAVWQHAPGLAAAAADRVVSVRVHGPPDTAGSAVLAVLGTPTPGHVILR